MKYLKQINESRIHHLYQPCGISCGNTVLKMLLNYYNISKNLSIEDLVDICGTDTKTGTTDKKLILGLEYTNVPYDQNKNKTITSLSDLKGRIGNELFLMRTLTRGIPHWILVYHYDGSEWDCMDPWLGEIKYSDDELVHIWEPRDFDGFFVPRILPKMESFSNFGENKYPISRINKNDIPEILELADIVFHDSGMDNKAYISDVADWAISIKMCDGDKIIGFYIFNRQPVPVPNLKYTGKPLQGVALGIDLEYKGKGLGKKLINYPYDHMGNEFDYIWGYQLKLLKNIDDWLKRREIIYETSDMYVTAGLLEK
jgi:GNAT superfamily N-acetyltransferase